MRLLSRPPGRVNAPVNAPVNEPVNDPRSGLRLAAPVAALFFALALLSLVACSDSLGSNSGSSTVKAQVPATANLSTGLARYSTDCASCHGPSGLGTASGNSLTNCESCEGSFDALDVRIRATMPQGNPAACEDTDGCARDTAAYILCAFNPDHAEGCDGAISNAVVPATANLTSGEAQYDTGCAFCHGANGSGTAFGSDLTSCQVCGGDFEDVENKIHTTMPPPNPAACADADACAENTAAFVLCSFNPSITDGCESASTKAVIPATANLSLGAADYGTKCAACHAADGNAPGSGNLIGAGCATCQGTFETLESKIHTTMPQFNSPACQGACAENTAAYIFCEFNPNLAEGCVF